LQVPAPFGASPRNPWVPEIARPARQRRPFDSQRPARSIWDGTRRAAARWFFVLDRVPAPAGYRYGTSTAAPCRRPSRRSAITSCRCGRRYRLCV